MRIKLHKLIVDRRSPTRHDLDMLNRIALPAGGLSAEQVYKEQCEAFNVERITDAFYREYTQRFRAAELRIKQENPALAAFSDATRLHISAADSTPGAGAGGGLTPHSGLAQRKRVAPALGAQTALDGPSHVGGTAHARNQRC